MRPRKLRRLYALAAFGAIVAGAALGTGVAKADPLDDVAFLGTLDHFGVHYGTEAAAISLGHTVCDGLAEGLSPLDIVRIGERSGAYSRTDSEYIVGAAIAAYCDQYGPLIGMPGGQVRA